jgi:hypothetical protein
MSNPLISFLSEILKRLFTQSPLFFKVWQWISMAALAVSGLPSLLTTLGITLPPALTVLENKFVTVGAAVALFMSMLTTQGTVAKKDDGTITTDSPKDKLPFTTQAQEKQLNAPPKN